jgi:hypothetical protein
MDLITRKKVHLELGPETGPNSGNGGKVVNKESSNKIVSSSDSLPYVVGIPSPPG